MEVCEKNEAGTEKEAEWLYTAVCAKVFSVGTLEGERQVGNIGGLRGIVCKMTFVPFQPFQERD